jgi:hypothetical protein
MLEIKYLLQDCRYITYCFAYIGTYVGDGPPQYDEDMEEAEEHLTVQRLCMPRRQDQRVPIDVVDHLCGFMISDRVLPAPIRDIL